MATRKQIWTVRVIQHMEPVSALDKQNRLPGVWVEQLRYMGLVRNITNPTSDLEVLEFKCTKRIFVMGA